MKSGDIIQYDFRKNKDPNLNDIKSIKLVQWNIERGYQMERIIKLLKEQDADIICLQEIDIGEEYFLK